MSKANSWAKEGQYKNTLQQPTAPQKGYDNKTIHRMYVSQQEYVEEVCMNITPRLPVSFIL